MESKKIEFPVVAHHRVIVRAIERDEGAMQELFKTFALIEPITAARSSASGTYISYNISVRFESYAEMNRFDESLKRVPGLKMVL